MKDYIIVYFVSNVSHYQLIYSSLDVQSYPFFGSLWIFLSIQCYLKLNWSLQNFTFFNDSKDYLV